MKQTAVEWLVEQLDGENHLTQNEIERLIQQAKAIEKEQIIESYCKGCADISKDGNIFPRETSEQYYNETYKSEQKEKEISYIKLKIKKQDEK